MSKAKSDATLEKERRPDGKFAPGVSGNKKGRPKKKVSPITDDFHDDIGDNSIKTLRKLMVTSTDRHEKAKLAKELAPYDAPKKASVESFSQEIKTIEIKWLTDMSTAPSIAPELEKELLGIIEHEVEEEILD
jgi:hypothetical protein